MDRSLEDQKKQKRILALNTSAFTICFAVWLLYAPLLKFLANADLYQFSASEIGLLLATPVLSGALFRLPVGVLTDRYGGRPVFVAVLLVSALAVLSVSIADSFWGFLLAGLFFGVAGSAFAVGVAFTSIWFEGSKQGFALGVFGAGNAGAAFTLMAGPRLLEWLTQDGTQLGRWRLLPALYAGLLVAMALVFFLFSENRRPKTSSSLLARFTPLRQVRVWRFGLYYVVVFGCFVGLSSWLLKYYVDVYGVSLQTAGWLAAAFSLPSSLIRAAGGWLSDRQGARTIMYWVLSFCVAASLLLCLPMNIYTFTTAVVLLGVAMGIGMAAVFKHIPAYFPDEVGVVGGMVGVLGGLGGFLCPIGFGYLLDATKTNLHPDGNWATSWMVIFTLALISLMWMHFTILRMNGAHLGSGKRVTHH